MVTIVTSFSQKQFQEYGDGMIASFDEYVDVPLVAYTEDGNEYFPPHLGKHIDLNEIEGWPEFEKRLRFPIMHGMIDEETYSINFDARMCRKSFIQADATKRFGGKVFWIDADVRAFDKVPTEFWHKVLPDDKLCCYLGRDDGKIPYTESGFLGFNSGHPLCRPFMNVYLDLIMSGAILTGLHRPRGMIAWHDCIAFDCARKSLPLNTLVNLAEGITAAHPFVNSILGCYFDHLKGARKQLGRSKPEDLIVARREDYWNDAG